MEKVSILQFRRDAQAIIRKVRQGRRLILTYRGKPVMRLEPIRERDVAADDPFYSIADLATGDGRSLSAEEIDPIVYQN